MAKTNRRNVAARKKDLWAGLKPGSANRTALSPLSFLPRAAEIYPDRIAVIHGAQRITYAQFYQRARRLASALAKRGVRKGDVVAAMLPNVPAMLDAHYGVPMLGAGSHIKVSRVIGNKPVTSPRQLSISSGIRPSSASHAQKRTPSPVESEGA